MTRMKIKTGDTVKILSGKDKGKQGKVTQVFPKLQKVVVEGMNMMTKNIRARQRNEKGQRVDFNAPIHVSNVMFVDAKSGKPTRLGSQMLENKKVRKAIRTKETVE